MRRVISIVLLFSPAVCWGQETPPESMAPARQTGAYLLKTCTASALTPTGRLRRQYCAGFLAGVEETLRVVTPGQAGFCPPGGVTGGELANAYTRFATANPESARMPAAAVAANALRQTFPCSPGQGQ